MLVKVQVMEILILHKQGYSSRKIAKMLGISRNTVKKYLKDPDNDPHYNPRPSILTKLEPFKKYIQERAQAAAPEWIPATVLFEEIKKQGYTGEITLLRDYLRTIKPQPKPDPVVRFETKPGEQMQVDWAKFKYGKQQLTAFIATLGFSRYTYVEFVKDETVNTLIKCQQNAFEFFGGVTKNVLYDNMKAVVIKRHGYGEGKHKYQDKFWDYAKHMGFIPLLCRPYRAKTKGKVERFIGYLRHSFFNPLAAQFKQKALILDDIAANLAVQDWLDNVANIREHATLKEQPLKLWLEREKMHLRFLPPLYLGLSEETLSNIYCKIIPLQHPIEVYEQIGQTAFREYYR